MKGTEFHQDSFWNQKEEKEEEKRDADAGFTLSDYRLVFGGLHLFLGEVVVR